jgi:hypothetical protein
LQTVANFIIRNCRTSSTYNKEVLRRGYDQDFSDRPMATTRRYRMPERETRDLNDLNAMILSLVHGARGHTKLETWFTMRGTEHYKPTEF